ncbi:hypothetical protein ACWCO3_29035 [Micromonospora sp. NPDC002411]
MTGPLHHLDLDLDLGRRVHRDGEDDISAQRRVTDPQGPWMRRS